MSAAVRRGKQFKELVKLVSPRRKRHILGLGLDNEDGHTRITRGENYHLLGGSQETHEAMQEKCAKLNEKLVSSRKSLDDLEHHELADLAQECGMQVAAPRRRPGHES